jgi:predicted ester cyclase
MPTLVHMTKSETNKQIVEGFITGLFTDGDLSAVDRYLDPAFVSHDPPLPGTADGPDGMRQIGELFRRAFPDWRSEVHQLLAEGDFVVESFVARGTHHGSVMGEHPTGREVVLRGINIFRIAGDKIVERWGCLDQLGLLQQLGLSGMPPLARAGD